MIRQVNKIGNITAEQFINDCLVVYRQAPLKFDLLQVGGVASPHNCYLNTELSQAGAKDLIEYIKALAIAQNEVWSESQLQDASEAQTIYICYFDFNNIFLNYSKEVLTKEDIETENEGANIWLSYDTSDIGLILLVNQLLIWMT